MTPLSTALTAAIRRHWSLLAVTAIYLATVGLLPRQGMWMVDNENRFLQVESLVAGGFREYAIHWPGRELDPGYEMSPLRFDPEGTFQALKDGHLIAVFQPAFIVLSAAAYGLLGDWGLYLLPISGAVLMLAGVARLAAELGQGTRARHLAVLLAGLATPAWFYSQAFWEHTSAAALCIWGLVYVLRFLATERWRDLSAGYALFAGAIFFRDVLAMFAVVVLGLLVVRTRQRRGRTALTAGTVLAAGLALLMTFQWATTDRPLGFHAGTLFGATRDLVGHVQARPRLFYLNFVASHPDRLWSFLLAAPFLAAFIVRPRLDATRIGTTRPGTAGLARWVPLWATAATVAGAVFLAGFLAAPSPPQRMLVAGGFFLASPVLILGLLRSKNEPTDARSEAGDFLLAAACLYAVLYCLIAPAAGSVSLHWGGRFLFSLYPLLATLAAGTISRWLDVAPRRLSWQGAVVVLLLLVSAADQAYAVRVLGRKKAYSNRLTEACAGFTPQVVVTNVWWAGHEMYASFSDKTIYYVKSQDQFDRLAKTLRARGIDRIVLATRPQAGARSGSVVRIDDDNWNFYSLDLTVTDLR